LAAHLREGDEPDFPAEQEDLVNLPRTASEGSKSIDEPVWGRFVAVRGTGIARLDPPMSAIHAQLGLVWIKHSLGIAFVEKADVARDTR
jgi:hypothetical protein